MAASWACAGWMEVEIVERCLVLKPLFGFVNQKGIGADIAIPSTGVSITNAILKVVGPDDLHAVVGTVIQARSLASIVRTGTCCVPEDEVIGEVIGRSGAVVRCSTV